MTFVNKMIAEDLDRSATGYVYDQRQGVPVYYVRYTNHGSGRFYHAPAAVQYVVEATPVAHLDAPETNPFLHPYAVANSVPSYQGTSNYDNEQSLEGEVARDGLYHVDGKIAVNERDDEGEEDGGGDGDEEKDEEEDEEGEIQDRSGGSVKLFGYGGYEDEEEVGEISSDDESGSFETGKGERYSEDGGKGEKGYGTWKEFSKGERGSNDDERREGEFFLNVTIIGKLLENSYFDYF